MSDQPIEPTPCPKRHTRCDQQAREVAEAPAGVYGAFEAAPVLAAPRDCPEELLRAQQQLAGLPGVVRTAWAPSDDPPILQVWLRTPSCQAIDAVVDAHCALLDAGLAYFDLAIKYA